ncbi:hypothetical protein [Methylobacter svalbardensis]|uniref:hypothetical protein n=1 Tax=Methylobacter svalbardensis TaxID=3080016 RepID=UPI0030EDB1C5
MSAFNIENQDLLLSKIQDDVDQSSTARPGTRRNSPVLLVTCIAFNAVRHNP